MLTSLLTGSQVFLIYSLNLMPISIILTLFKIRGYTQYGTVK